MPSHCPVDVRGTLSFLGLGVLAPIRIGAAMLNNACGHLFDAPHMVVSPALAVMTAVLSFNLLGDAWRDWLDPRTRSQMATQEFCVDFLSKKPIA
jgi:ABC-type dipeptide/oligopeptide/nickel transport system permease subunit